MKTKQLSVVGTLTVNGEGEIKVKPEIAILDLGVTTLSKNAKDAVQANAERMSAVIKALEAKEVGATDLQTVGYNVSPIIDYDEKSPTFGQVLEYRVDAQLRATVDVERAGEAIDAAIRAGASSTSGLRFGVRDESALRNRALKAAVKAARRDADAVVDAMGYKLLDAQSVEVTGGSGSVIIRPSFREAAAPTPIEGGTITIRASVRTVFAYG